MFRSKNFIYLIFYSIMKHLAAFALLVLGGKENPTAADVEKLLKDAGVKADTEKI